MVIAFEEEHFKVVDKVFVILAVMHVPLHEQLVLAIFDFLRAVISLGDPLGVKVVLDDQGCL